MAKTSTRGLAFGRVLLMMVAACGGGGTGADDASPDADAAADLTADLTADRGADAPGDAGPELPPIVEEGTLARFDLSVDLDTAEHFYDFPWPSDLRLTARGTPAMTHIPSPGVDLVAPIIAIADQRPGFPVTPVAWFRFSADPAPRTRDVVIAADPTSPLLLVDVDPDSPERGRLFPLVATTPPVDGWVPEHLLAMSARPGFVLAPDRTYAFVVTRAAKDAAGQPLGIPADLQRLARGEVPAGARGAAAAALYAPLWPTLDGLGVARDQVAAATVFTTGDVVAETARLSDQVLADHDATLGPLTVDPDDGADHSRYCELHGTLTLPQFQRGEAPFDTEGLFEFDASGRPVLQREETVPIVVTMPRQPMPAGGYPLVLYFHGSGGLASQVVDRGTIEFAGGPETPGEGPAWVLAAHGFGAVGAALPVNPERVPGASSIEYLNLANLAAFRDTFRQGVIEQRLMLEALDGLRVAPATVAACAGMSLPAGEESYRFATAPILAMGQSMGGMYANMIGATEPRIEAVVPTGAGGFWSFFILQTQLLNAGPLLGPLLEAEDLSFLHPSLHTMQTAWEPAEPMVYMPRLAHRPLPGHPVRPIYEPVGKGDSFFSTTIYDAIVLAYGHPQAGAAVWPEMQQSLALAGLDGFLDYPVHQDLQSVDGEPYTGVVVQYEGDGWSDPHTIFTQLDAVKYQYGCFLETFRDTGTATVPAPAPLGTPCPKGP
ncbi:MAG: hypothetical protein H6744_05620 [Deltaproteobacteria bacterium]|nr:hypothetical protein [Deltaproteobacteria bacterium]MCB9786158.1 hypothetical protein [Deltaproteobacteria bacterium]